MADGGKIIETLILLASGVLYAWAALILYRLFCGESPFVPAPGKYIGSIASELKLHAGSALYELGCGDGRVLLKAARLYPDAKLIGIEKNLIPYLLARWNSRNHPAITIIRGNFFETNLKGATHVFTYLFPSVMARLSDKFKKELKSGTIIVSLDFHLPNFKLTEEKKLGRHSLLKYTY